MEDDQLFILIKKYLDGNCSPEEKLLIENWYEQQEDNGASFYKGDAERMAGSSRRSLEIIHQAISKERSAPKFRKLYKSTLFIRGMAAAACLLVCGFAALYFYQKKLAVTEYAEVTAGNGRIIQLSLADHTSVWLNAGSRLKYPKTSGGKTREVYLEGEAYFDVAHDAARPFKVHTSRLTTTVLGTAFSVTAYQHTKKESVTVMRGKVEVADAKKVLGLLTPDRKVDYELKGGKSTFSTISAASVLSWKQGKLQFENEEMEEIAARLGRWYGYTFRFDNAKMKSCRYTASFSSAISMNDMLEVMKAISRISYKVDTKARVVTLYGKECND